MQRSHSHGHSQHHHHHHGHGHRSQYMETDSVTVVTEVERVTSAVTGDPCHGGAMQQHVVRKEVFEEVDEEYRRGGRGGRRYEACEEDVAGGEYVQLKESFLVRAG